MKQSTGVCNVLSIVLVVLSFGLSSCDAILQGMADGLGGYGGYGMGGYQVMPGGFVRNTSYDYLLDPNVALQNVLNKEQQEYQAAKQYRPDLTLEQFRLEKGQALQMMNSSSSNSATSSSSSRISNNSEYSGSSSSSMCSRCVGTGRCKTCEGKGYYYNPLDMSKTVLCPNCQSNHNGKCAQCGGTGKR